MASIINHNMSAMNAQRQMGVNSTSNSKSLEKLSSGLRINRAGDDAAGLSISEKMRGQIRGLNQASRNSQDGISMIQTAEGSLNESHDIVQRMRELAVQASNGTNQGEDRDQINKEFSQLKDELNRIASQTQFNKMDLLASSKTISFQVGANANQTISIDLKAMDTKHLGVAMTASGVSAAKIAGSAASVAVVSTASVVSAKIAAAATTASAAASITAASVGAFSDGYVSQAGESAGNTASRKASAIASRVVSLKKIAGSAAKISTLSAAKVSAQKAASGKVADKFGLVDDLSLSGATADQAQKAITVLDLAINTISSFRSDLGSVQNRLEHTIKATDNTSENLQASESRIRDVDMASEMLKYQSSNVLTQAAQSMLAQANQQPNQVLQLLQ